MCTERRNRGLENRLVTTSLLDHAQQIDGNWNLRAAVVMPDHVHLLVDLTASSELSEAVHLFKGRPAAVLRRHDMKWQRGYFCSPDDWFWFEPLTSSSLPFPEWLTLIAA